VLVLHFLSRHFFEHYQFRFFDGLIYHFKRQNKKGEMVVAFSLFLKGKVW